MNIQGRMAKFEQGELRKRGAKNEIIEVFFLKNLKHIILSLNIF